MMFSSIVVLALLLHISVAQFNQRYNDVNGVPHWQRQPLQPNRPVLQPRYPVYLEYNCAKLPSICLNVRQWLNDPQKSTWNGRAGNDVFTYDMYAAEKQAYLIAVKKPSKRRNREHRRDLMCGSNWRGTRGDCPESNQPDVLPGPWPHKGLETIITNTALYEIEALRIGNNPPVRSGRQYTCDEFPPASWVEGGVGLGGTATQGTTFCAPFGACKAGGKKSSEQDWQGSSHAALSKKLTELLNARWLREGRGTTWSRGDTVQFHFRMVNIAGGHAAYIRWQDDATGSNDFTTIASVGGRRIENDFPANMTFYERAALGSSMTDRDLIDYGYKTDTLIIPEDDTEPFMRLAGGIDVPVSQIEFEEDLGVVNTSSIDTERTNVTGHGLPEQGEGISLPNSTVAAWNISATDVDESLTAYNFETQQEHRGENIDIIRLSEMYILGQLSSPNATANHSAWNGRTASQHPHTTRRLIDKRAVEGPIQCGPGQPCKDGACCNKDGKCGFKDVHCGPDVCLSNCSSKAMCGIDSLGGTQKCGLKLCCSYYGWCGTEQVHCDDPEPQFGRTPCQQGFGSCATTDPPSCGKGSGTSKGRRIGYYQGWNTRERVCDKVSPKQINTQGLTHLYYAFVFFHPTTFEMMPMNEADIPLYTEFTSLKTNKLQTWVAVGGWSFNDDNTATRTAYSDMVSTSANRAAFINSLIKFMDTYGFQGADIDWEYPSEPKRGGRTEDADNLVMLMKEMRAAFGTKYGISIALAPDYWYLRGFKPAEMQQYVDFMGFMSYDLHGPWDTDVLTLGSLIRPQTDITEIDKNLVPLWFDGVDPAKINMGFAYYGRSYKLADPSCGRMGCPFIPKEGGSPGKCTNFPGVMSNREIRQLIQDENITPILNETAMVKYFTYDKGSSWIGYDDKDTFALKQAFANDRCLGGIMIWSIDFDAETGGSGQDDEPGGSNDDNLVWIDPKIWKQPTPTAQCYFPCTLVLPPFPIETSTRIPYPRVTITSSDTVQHTSSVKGTITFPPITVTEVGLRTIVISGGSTSCTTTDGSSSCTTYPPATTELSTSVKLSTTTTWPASTWVDDEHSRKHTTRPKTPEITFPPPSFSIKLPEITIRYGEPSPAAKRCAYAALDCPPASYTNTKTSMVVGPAPEPSNEPAPEPGDVNGPPPDDEGDEGDDEDTFCVLPDPTNDEPTPGSPSTAAPPPPPATTTTPPKNTPNFDKDSDPSCYNKGYKANRGSMITAIDSFCAQMVTASKGKTLGKGVFEPDSSDMSDDKSYIVYHTSFEVLEGCEWGFDEAWCKFELRKPLDKCNTKGENGKQGGTLDGNCIKWKLYAEVKNN